MPAKLGIIAGRGDAPVLIAERCRSEGRPHVVLALEGHAETDRYPGSALHTMRVGAVGSILGALDKEKVEEIVIIGAVKRPNLLQLRPDAAALKLMAKIGYANHGDDGLLRRLIDYLETDLGYRVVSADSLLAPDTLLTPSDLTTRAQPSDQDLADIARGRSVLEALAAADVGQSVLVQEGAVLGVEAIEGTDALIDRCAAYRREGSARGVLVKLAKLGQERRADLPTVGAETVRRLAASGFAGLAIDPTAALLIDPPGIVSACDEAGLFLQSIDQGDGR
ncbi:MAG: UDP-2,3-diacylglucosamine diphosphatase LpxI [Alphaproteobacteria bacterium]|nr:UDP-2,3-diacylglucosamine diphosphatase LpxI [Alphaproteobacteria bacterium]